MSEVEKLKALNKQNIDLAIAHLAQIYGLIEQGKVNEASDYCLRAAESWRDDEGA